MAARRPDRPGPPVRSLMTTAFVLSGGASLGAVQVGMLQALSDASVGGRDRLHDRAWGGPFPRRGNSGGDGKRRDSRRFPPVRIGGHDLIDGGVADYAPISQAVALGADCFYVLPAAHACALASPPRSALTMALHSLNLMIESRIAADVERLCGEVELHVLPHPCPLSVSPADFSHSGDLIERAHRTATHRLSSRSKASGAGFPKAGVE